MSDAEWTRTIPESQVLEGAPQVVKIGDKEVVLLRVRGAIRALPQECPHYQKALSKGVLSVENGNGGRCILTCHSHFARFDAESGELIGPPALDHLARYEVRVEDGTVLVQPAKRVQFPPLPEGDSRVFVIVGGGAAGQVAAETLRREGFGGRIVMLTREADRPYDRPNLSKEYLSGEAKPEWMPLRSEKFYANRKIEVRTASTVTGLSASHVTLAGGEQIAFDKLLLASGCEPRTLEVPGGGLAGCHTLRSLADGQAIVAALEGARRVVVVGASFIAMEAASSLRKRGVEVDIVAPEPIPMASLFGDRVGRRLRSFAERAGVHFHLGSTVRQIAGGERVRHVILSTGETLSADLVLVGIGVVPAVGYLAGTGLVRDGGVPVGPDLQTAQPGVYAAGDIAIVAGARVEHWVVAETQGQHAARAMLGKPVRFASVPFFWTGQFGQSLKYVGYAPRPDSVAHVGDVEEGKFLTGYFVAGSLRAAATVGRAQDLIRIQQALERGSSISPESFESGAYATA